MSYELDEIFYSIGVDPQLGQTLKLPPGESDPVSDALVDAAALVAAGAIGYAADQVVPAGTMTPSGWPAAVPVVATAWDTSRTPARYTVQGGDTLSGLAATYLGDPARWRDIWNEQPQQYRWTHSPDVLAQGQVLNMPAEALANFLKWKRGGSDPGELPGDQPAPSKLRKAAPWIVGGALAAVVVAYGSTKV
jgi:LysM repeat protein